MGVITFLQEFAGLLKPITLFHALWSTQLGIIMGMLPGLTATMGIALLTGLTFGFPSDHAMIILICVYVGAIYGGSRSAILLNIPGTPANAAAAVDGFPLARRGEAGEAIGLATTFSGVGSFLGLIALMSVTPLLGQMALKFGSWEFFWLAIFGVIICGQLTAPADPLKGWIAGIAGLLFSCVGLDGLHSHPRFTLGSVELTGGLSLIPVMVGAYGISEMFSVMKETGKFEVATKVRRVVPRLAEMVRYWKTTVRSGIIGTLIGVIPGVGEDIAAWIAYDFAKRASRTPEEFGKGSRDGLIASETANNAAVGGAIIPVLTLAVPGSAPAAVLLAAMWLHGIRPGPLLPIENPTFIYTTAAIFGLATLAMVVLGLMMVRPLVKVLQVPKFALVPVVFTLSAIGAYAINVRVFDIYLALIFGIVGFFMRDNGYPVAPFVLGFILGPMADVNMRRALILTGGDPTPFFTRPISLVLAVACVLTMLSRTELFASRLKGLRRAPGVKGQQA